MAQGRSFDPQRYDADRGLRRMLDVELTEKNQIRKFAASTPSVRTARSSRGRALRRQYALPGRAGRGPVPTNRAATCGRTPGQGGLRRQGQERLRARMRQYVTSRTTAPRSLLVDQIDRASTTSSWATSTSRSCLREPHQPVRTVLQRADFKDDKSYPCIAITRGRRVPGHQVHARAPPTPARKLLRPLHRQPAPPATPWTSLRRVRAHMRRHIVRRVAAHAAHLWNAAPDQASRCKPHACREVPRPCFDAHVGKAPGVVLRPPSTPEECAAHARHPGRALPVRAIAPRRSWTSSPAQMQEAAAAELDFERAARIKRTPRHHRRPGRPASTPMFPRRHEPGRRRGGPLPRGDRRRRLHVFVVREGRVIRSERVRPGHAATTCPTTTSRRVLPAASATTTPPRPSPHEVVPALTSPSDRRGAWGNALAQKLAGRPRCAGALHRPAAAARRPGTVGMACAERDAHALMRYKVRTGYDGRPHRTTRLLQLESALALDGPPLSHRVLRRLRPSTARYTVASMVVFTNGRPDKSPVPPLQDPDAELDEANDFVCACPEVLGRRYAPERMARRALRQPARPPRPRRRQAPAHRRAWGACSPSPWASTTSPYVRPGQVATRRSVRAPGRTTGPGRAAHRLRLALPGQAGARRVRTASPSRSTASCSGTAR